MRVTALQLRNFRNISKMEFEPVDGVNIIYGENAQGKTNLLEGIWLFTGMRSFRSTKEKDYIQFGQSGAGLQMKFNNDVREQNASIEIGEKKKVLLGGVKQDSTASLVGEFLGTIFSPGHLELVQGSPGERRKFLNQAISELKPNYASRLTQFHRVLHQRNILLKDLRFHPELADTLAVWDESFASLSAFLIRERRNYLEQLKPHLKEFYSGISGGREEIDISYQSTLPAEGEDAALWREPILNQLSKSCNDDITVGYTTVGPHRDDLHITLNGMPVKEFGSQGQQRSCALSLKMAEAIVIREITGKQPVVLLDDVMSELDSGRQDYILNHIDGWQVFLTCCEPSGILLSRQSQNGRMFEIKEGRLCSST